MATLVLTAAGGLIAGPLGAALGAIAGQRIDSSLFAPKGRQGPRLGELSVQTSSYGTPIPKIFGTIRVAGTVIWSTDLKEEKSRSGGGKGRPATETYSYSASFAVALSARRIRAVHRIWADGKLLRGVAGDFKSQTQYRLYLGTEEQPIDPLIAAEEGSMEAPGHRGIAYALFEDFQLADYGNRIPSLTFEVEADPEPVAIGAIAEELTQNFVRQGQTPTLAGYAASGDSIRSAIEAVSELVPLSLKEVDGQLVLSEPDPAVTPIGSVELEARTPSGSGGRAEFSRKASTAVASEVSISYYDSARDYQTGLQRAYRGSGSRTERNALPAALTAEAAKHFAERRLAHLWAARQTAKLHLASRWGGARPGTLVQLRGEAGTWKVLRWTLQKMTVSLELVRMPGGGSPVAEASSGRPAAPLDAQHGPTTLFLFELPGLGDELPVRPQIVAMAAGTEAGWRRAALLASFDGGRSWTPAGSTSAPAVMGHATTALPVGDSALVDERNSIDVELLNENMWLESRSDEALAAGANAAVLGEELIQFGRATPIGPRSFRLSRLLRGRRGTEWAASAHSAGEPFALIEREAMAAIDPLPTTLGAEVQLLAQGVGDPPNPRHFSLIIRGQALAPPSPVHLRAEQTPTGAIEISWTRRSRIGWAWGAGTDAPLGEEAEAYQLRISGPAFDRRVALNEARYLYTAEQQSADGSLGSLRIEVTQVGTHAPSKPVILII